MIEKKIFSVRPCDVVTEAVLYLVGVPVAVVLLVVPVHELLSLLGVLPLIPGGRLLILRLLLLLLFEFTVFRIDVVVL